MSLEFSGRNILFILIEIFLGTLVHVASVSYDNNVGKSSEFQCGSVMQKPCFFPLKFTFEFVSQRQILAMINWLFPRQWIKDHWVQVHTLFMYIHFFWHVHPFLDAANKKEGVICDSIQSRLMSGNSKPMKIQSFFHRILMAFPRLFFYRVFMVN